MNRKSVFFSTILLIISALTCYCQSFYSPKETDSILNTLQYLKIKEEDSKKAIDDINAAIPKIKNDSAKIVLNKQKAFLYGRLRNEPMVLKSHLENKELVKRSKNIHDKIYLNLALAEVYTYLKMFNMAHQNLDEAELLLKDSELSNATNILAVTSIRQLAYFDSGKYDLCIKKSKEVIANKDKMGNKIQQNFIEMFSNQLIAKSYLELKEYDKVKPFLDRSITLDKNSIFEYQLKNNNTLVRYYYETGNADSALYVLDHFELKEKTSYPELLSIRYGLMIKLYALKKDEQKVSFYMAQRDSLDRLNKNSDMRAVEDSFLRTTQEIEKTVQNKDLLIYLVSGGIIVLLIVLIYFYKKKKKEHKQFEKIISELKQQKLITIATKDQAIFKDKTINLGDSASYLLTDISETKVEENKVKPESTNSNISEERETLILSQLDKFEKSEKFLNPNTSLSSVANLFKTNQTYLSEIINKQKGVNFSMYIHQLRINYLLNALNKDSKLLSYKIAYLAELCGYTSYETFTRVFKSVVGLSPSSYISQVKNSI